MTVWVTLPTYSVALRRARSRSWSVISLERFKNPGDEISTR